MQQLPRDCSLFSQRRRCSPAPSCSSRDEALPGAARDTRAGHWAAGKTLADGACGGVSYPEEVGAKAYPAAFQRGGVKAGADGGIEELSSPAPQTPARPKARTFLFKQVKPLRSPGRASNSLYFMPPRPRRAYGCGCSRCPLEEGQVHRRSSIETLDPRYPRGRNFRADVEHQHPEAVEQADQLVEDVLTTPRSP